MKIISFNVAGFRAMLKKQEFEDFINDPSGDYDIICLQEIKAEEKQLTLPSYLDKYQFKYYNSTKGTTQRKGLSGVSIMSKIEPTTVLDCPEFDEEGRILTLIYNEFILVNIYVPNSQRFECERYYFRENWNLKFSTYIGELTNTYKKEIIICGDLNVAHLNIDIVNPKKKENKVPGFFDNERKAFYYLLFLNNLKDVFRKFNPIEQKSTYWSNFLKAERSQTNGWGIDYYLATENILSKITDCKILMNIKGSDHCPLLLELKET